MKGIIDELQLDELGKVRIVEHKTRRRSSVPSDAQKETARLQVHSPFEMTSTALAAHMHSHFVVQNCGCVERQHAAFLFAAFDVFTAGMTGSLLARVRSY